MGACRIEAADGWCVGCLRSLDEIAAWSRLPPDAKRQVLAMLPERRVQRDARGQARDD